MTRRVALPLFGMVCFLALLLIGYRSVLFEDGQFAYRDASQFYYPLHLRVRQEWDAGRWPLWDPGQNGGVPLLGNPMAAVLYPGKVLYAFFPYAWGARLYVIAHTVIAFVGMLALGRTFGVSWVGSCLGGLSYSFGAPVLFQYCNVIFLVGAAWLPWGLRGIDLLLRQQKPRGGVELAVVLALQVLGGDPEAGYLTAVSGAGYAIVLALRSGERLPRLFNGSMAAVAVVVWIAGTLGLAWLRIAPPRSRAAWALVLLVWAAVGIGIVRRWRRRPGEARLAPMLAGLGCSTALALALSAAQLLPVLEFVGKSVRVEENQAIHVYAFSLEPYRLIELVWPNVFGTICPENRSWLQAIPPVGDRDLWVCSLYMGSLALLLALSAARLRDGPPWVTWLTAIAVVGLLASFGKFAGPLWWARWTPIASAIGPHDLLFRLSRDDGCLNDGTGSPYGVLSMLLPGFAAFRYPSKVLTFTAVALAALAGAGWDGLVAGTTNRLRRLGWLGLGASVLGLAIALAASGRAVAYLTGRIPSDPMFGPADVPASWSETQRALAHGAIVFAALLGLTHWAPRRPRVAGVFALLLLTADLALANARLIWTAPQADFEAPSEVARLIESAERADPASGPFRFYRMSEWYPARFLNHRSPDRVRELLRWERNTLSMLHGLPMGLEACTIRGTVELNDTIYFFGPQIIPIPAEPAKTLGVPTGSPVTFFPRRGFDLWGARYFLLPVQTDQWRSKERGFASFLPATDLIHPSPERLRERENTADRESWSVREDWQVLRNRAAYPRAWLVHYARVRPPVTDPADRLELMKTLLFMNELLWSDPDRPVFDLHAAAWIETDDSQGLKGFISRRPVEPSESVVVTIHAPQRVELKATLNRPGLVILADTYYPGWRLTIDGRPAPIYRTNRMMRGATVPAGMHTLVYTFDPASFRIGLVISMAALIVLMGLIMFPGGFRRPVQRSGPGG